VDHAAVVGAGFEPGAAVPLGDGNRVSGAGDLDSGGQSRDAAAND
jgi:hypothetical protein